MKNREVFLKRPLTPTSPMGMRAGLFLFLVLFGSRVALAAGIILNELGTPDGRLAA